MFLDFAIRGKLPRLDRGRSVTKLGPAGGISSKSANIKAMEANESVLFFAADCLLEYLYNPTGGG